MSSSLLLSLDSSPSLPKKRKEEVAKRVKLMGERWEAGRLNNTVVAR